MQLFQEIQRLLIKEFQLEWRQKYSFSGVLLYVFSTVMLIYMSFQSLEPIVWSTMFWVILLFASVNAVAKSFLQENKARYYYYYLLTSPTAVLISKIIYNTLLLLLLAVIALAVYIILLGNPIVHIPLFIGIVLAGSISFSFCFTILSAIAAQVGNNATIMPILSFPVIIPILSLLVILSKSALVEETDIDLNIDFLILFAIDGLLLVLSLILFPYLWRD